MEFPNARQARKSVNGKLLKVANKIHYTPDPQFVTFYWHRPLEYELIPYPILNT